MTQLVFIHGPGAGGCAAAWVNQLRYFQGSLAPSLPGSLEGDACQDIKGYMEWVRGWLWSKGKNKELVLMGYTTGSAIALQYALDYPGEVKGLILTSVAPEPAKDLSAFHKRQEMRLRAASGDAEAYKEWIAFQERAQMWVDPALRKQLVEWHRKVGPLSQYQSLVAYSRFDVKERLKDLKARLLLIRGGDDPGDSPEGEQAIHEILPQSQYVRIEKAGHFPATEQAAIVNKLIEDFVQSL